MNINIINIFHNVAKSRLYKDGDNDYGKYQKAAFSYA